MKKDHFVTRENSDGEFSQTLTQHLGLFLSDIETKFGPRDTSFTILGIEIVETKGSPHIWFPASRGDHKHVIVRLAENTLDCETLARWQLAHECVHLLDPRNNDLSGPTSVLEEGIATWYQNCKEGRQFATTDSVYAEAETLVLPLMGVLPDAIRRIRQKEGIPIGDIKEGVLRKYCPQVSLDTAQCLTQQCKGGYVYRGLD